MLQVVQDLRSGAIEVVELPDPVPGEGEVLVCNTWSVISPGTEQAISQTAARSLVGKALDRPDQVRKVIDTAVKDGVGSALASVRARLDDLMTPGYSSAGVVEAVGARVDGVRPGDRVGCVGANAACHAEKIVLAAPLCVPLPASLDDRWGAFGALGGIAAHAVRLAGIEAGATVVVLGMGLVGQLTAQLVTAAGALVVAVDLLSERVELAKRLGAAAAVVPGREDVDAVVRSFSDGHGADAVIVAAATKDSQPIDLAASLARDRATITVVGDVGMEIQRASFYEKELQLRISRSYGPGRYDPSYEREGHDYPIGYVRWTERRIIQYFFREVAAGRVRLSELVSHEFPIERGGEAYEALSDPSRMAVLLRYRHASAPARRMPVTVKGLGRAGRLRVGVIGPGLFARSTLLPQLRKLDVELSAVAGKTPARAFGVARRWKAGYVATSAEEIVNDQSIDVVLIATRHDSHAELAAAALERGKAVFLEKPLAIDKTELERLVPLLEDRREQTGRLVVDFNRAFAPMSMKVTEHFHRREEPLHIHHRVNAGYLEPSHWLRDIRQGGGRLVGEACHFIDLCSAFVGQPLRSVQVAALGSGPKTLAGDNFELVLRYADGSLASIAYISSSTTKVGKERIELFGSGRAALLDDFRRLELQPGPRRLRPGGSKLQDKGYSAILDAAFHFFRAGGEPPIPYERLLETTRATFIARDALNAGEDGPVELIAS